MNDFSRTMRKILQKLSKPARAIQCAMRIQ
nr:MAG TPA: hypothetical protein [Bacteriophage sp.]